jgi:hypothetical protein
VAVSGREQLRLRVFTAVLAVAWLALYLALPRPLSVARLGVAGVALAFVVGLGLWLAGLAGLGAPLLEHLAGGPEAPSAPGRVLATGVLCGLIVGGGVLLTVKALLPAVPQLRARLAAEAGLEPWRRLIIAADSAVLEEILFRLLLVSALVVLARRAGRSETGRSAGWTTWVPVVAVALAFGAAHLVPWMGVVKPTPALIAGVIVLNGAGGVVFGAMFVKLGFESAVIAHFCADVVLHGVGPAALALSGPGAQ